MTIVLLLIASLFLVMVMLILTVGVNDLEKKSIELAALIKHRYTIQNIPKSKNKVPEKAPPGGPGTAVGGIVVPPLGKPPGKP